MSKKDKAMSEMNISKIKRPPVNMKTLGRLFKMLFKSYPIAMPLTIICILLTSVSAAAPDVALKKVIDSVDRWMRSGDWQSAKAEIIPEIKFVVVILLLGIVAIVTYTQLMAKITQGFLNKIRCELFNKMQNLPIRYFDTNKTGDIMSHYTNDVDTIRQLVSQSIPSIVRAGAMVIFVFCIMLNYSLWMTLILMLGVVAMSKVTKIAGGGSAKYFFRQQQSIGKTEGFIQEMMNGQKVVKVFNHEEFCKEDFDRINEQLYSDSEKAHTYANILMPIVQNIGNVIYVLIAVVGGIFIANNVPNVSISGTAFSISVVVTFLNMTKQFTGNVGQLSQQINSIVMGMAGAERVFNLMDKEPESDDGLVTLVNAKIAEDGTIEETDQRTGRWAWKDILPDGTCEYTELKGDVRFVDVDFGYNEDKEILHNIKLYAEPGQKVAFVGATGAGKTTITNLINRYYDVNSGKIQYDHINVNRIKKSDLRRSLGLVLQETNLFTGTVMDNIRYGNLGATDEQCIEAARIAGAHGFITRLPKGYKTMLTANGSNLSQGQRQLIAIARAAVADPPVMILDEATSSIDTHTESIVQRGMDNLMKGRTTFVIAHRLSTVMDADVIMVMDHGNIIERGSHDELIAEKGVYYQLYTGAFELE